MTSGNCRGFCAVGPTVIILPAGILYCRVRPEDVSEIVEKTLIGGEVVERLRYPGVARAAGPAAVQGRAVLQSAGADRPAQLRRRRSREHRGVHRPRRLPRAGQGRSPR